VIGSAMENVLIWERKALAINANKHEERKGFKRTHNKDASMDRRDEETELKVDNGYNNNSHYFSISHFPVNSR